LIEFKDYATSLFYELVEAQDMLRIKMTRLQDLITHLRGIKEKVETQNLESEATHNCI